jgi:hypothetical protein
MPAPLPDLFNYHPIFHCKTTHPIFSEKIEAQIDAVYFLISPSSWAQAPPLCLLTQSSLCCTSAACLLITHGRAPWCLLISASCYKQNYLSSQNHLSSGQGTIFPIWLKRKLSSPKEVFTEGSNGQNDIRRFKKEMGRTCKPRESHQKELHMLGTPKAEVQEQGTFLLCWCCAPKGSSHIDWSVSYLWVAQSEGLSSHPSSHPEMIVATFQG